MIEVLVAEFRCAVAEMVVQANQAEDAALSRAAKQDRRLDEGEAERGAALRLYGEIRQLREAAERVATTVTILTATMSQDTPPRRRR